MVRLMCVYSRTDPIRFRQTMELATFRSPTGQTRFRPTMGLATLRFSTALIPFHLTTAPAISLKSPWELRQPGLQRNSERVRV
jgi:hypothetical protein